MPGWQLLPSAAAALLLASAAAATSISLDGEWQLQRTAISGGGPDGAGPARGAKLAAAVPGTVQGALFAAGAAPDPQFGRNQLAVYVAAASDTYTYTRQFATPAACITPGARCELVFGGIDTAATVRLNGLLVGKANNMHLRFLFDVTKELTQSAGTASSKNTLEVEIEPAVQYAQREAAANGDPNCTMHTRTYWPEKWGHGTKCSSYIRKNTGSFGWDCAPAYMTAGIWKSVSLRVVRNAVIDLVAPQISGSVNPKNPDSSNEFDVEVRVFVVAATAGMATVSVAGSWSADATTSSKVQLQPSTASTPQLVTVNLSASNVKLWWPHGTEGARRLGISRYNLTTT